MHLFAIFQSSPTPIAKARLKSCGGWLASCARTSWLCSPTKASADGYELFEFQTGPFLIGSNGGPTAYGLIGENFISIPFVFAGAWSDEVRVLGKTFDEFIEAVDAGEGS